MRIRVLALAALFLTIVACDGTEPAVPTSVRVMPATVTFQTVGETQQLTAEVLDASGSPIAGTFTFSWTSSATSSVSVSTAGLATANAAGTATITASAEGVSGTGTATVDQTATDLQIDAGDGQTGEAGLPLATDLAVLVLDAGGNPAGLKSVTFSVVEGGGSVNPSTATTNLQGRATTQWTLGSTPGVTQTARASISGLQQDFGATAAQGILRVQTDALNNSRVTLAYQDALTGAGGDGSYTFAITGGQLPAGLALNSSGQITGTPSQVETASFTAQVQDGLGATATKSLNLTVCPAPLQIGFGQIIETQAGTGSECGMFLPSGSAGDAYRVALVRASSDSTISSTTLELRASGLVAAPAVAPLTAAFEQPIPRNRLNLTPEMMESIRTEERTEALHARIREGEARLIASLDRSQLMPSRAADAAGGRMTTRAAQLVDPPASRVIIFPNAFGNPPSCSDGNSNPSTLRGFNDHLAIYEADSNSPTVGQAQVDQMLNYYRDYGDQVIQSYFGGVTDIDGDGRIVLLITPDVPSGTAAFVWSGDFFPTNACPDSNVGEFVYFSPGVVEGMVDGNYQGLNTVVHEAKHISSLYNRIANPSGAPFHPGFIEEGTAEIAAEVAGRLSWAATGGPAVGTKITGAAWDDQFTLTGDNYGIFLRMARMVLYLSSQPNGVSWSYTPRQGGIYGGGVMFHRWLGDAYGGASTPLADAPLFRNQNDSLTTGGIGAYPSLVGMSYTELLQEYGKAVMMHGTGFETGTTYTTYDLSTSTEVFSQPDPAGTFPWPVTLTCDGAACPDDIDSRDPESLPDNDDRNIQVWAPFANSTFDSPMGAGGIRVFEFQSSGSGDGVEVVVTGATQTKVYVSRIR